MNFLKRNYTLRRYSEPFYDHGYSSIPYTDQTLPMDIQTLQDIVETTSEGRKSIQRLKVFCDYEIYVENERTHQKADRVWFQGKWFECQSSRLSENTPLRHWTAEFIQCLDAEDGPSEVKECDSGKCTCGRL